MVGVLVEAISGEDRLEVALRARSIEGAVSLVAERYPHCHVGVRFPIDPEGFFVEEPSANGLIEEEQKRWAA